MSGQTGQDRPRSTETRQYIGEAEDRKPDSRRPSAGVRLGDEERSSKASESVEWCPQHPDLDEPKDDEEHAEDRPDRPAGGARERYPFEEGLPASSDDTSREGQEDRCSKSES